MTSAFGIDHGEVAKGYNVLGTYAKPVKLARGKLLPVKTKKAPPKHKADVTPWDKYGIGKSYVPGKGFVSATAPGSKAMLRGIKPGRYKDQRGVSEEDFQYRIGRARRKVLVGEATKKTKTMRTDAPTRTRWGFGRTGRDVAGFTVRSGSKSQGRNTVVLSHKLKRAEVDSTYNHELAHAAPKRSEYRVHHQIASDPQKMIREEARADMAGGNYWRNPESRTDSGYTQIARIHDPSDTPPMAAMKERMYGFSAKQAGAYRGVQDKIAGARRKRG